MIAGRSAEDYNIHNQFLPIFICRPLDTVDALSFMLEAIVQLKLPSLKLIVQ